MEKSKEGFIEKTKRYVPYELFWYFLGFVLVGIFLILIGIFNFYKWSSTSRVIALLSGIILTIVAIWRMKANYKKM